MAFDLVIRSGDLFATVEFKFVSGATTSYWDVLSLDQNNLPILLFRGALTLPLRDESSTLESAREVFESYVKPLSLLALDGGGLREAPEFETSAIANAFEIHAREFEGTLRESGAFSEPLLTGGLYRLTKLLGVKKPVSSLAHFLRLPESTVSRRLTRLRDAGLIDKKGGKRSA